MELREYTELEVEFDSSSNSIQKYDTASTKSTEWHTEPAQQTLLYDRLTRVKYSNAETSLEVQISFHDKFRIS